MCHVRYTHPHTLVPVVTRTRKDRSFGLDLTNGEGFCELVLMELSQPAPRDGADSYRAGKCIRN